MANQNYIYDAIGDFSLGMNSGLDPFMLPKNQASFCVNCSDSGNFLTNRPAFKECPPKLDGSTGSIWFKTPQLFQGACYYRPDSGYEQIVAQIAGRLYAITPTSDGSFVSNEVSVPLGDHNSPSLSQAWLWQSERWVIIQNGVQNAIAFDGVSSRRLNPVSSLQGVSDLASTPTNPAVNGTMVLAFTGTPYVGVLNQSIQLIEYDSNGIISANTTYEIVAANGAVFDYVLTVQNVATTPGKMFPAGTKILDATPNLGSIVSQSPIIYSSYGTSGSGFREIPAYRNITTQIVLASAIPGFLSVGSGISTVSATGATSNWKIASISADGKTIGLVISSSVNLPPLGVTAFITDYSGSINVVGVLKTAMTTANAGVDQPVHLTSAYTQSIPKNVYFDSGYQFTVDGYETVPVAAATSLTLKNLNDTRSGHVFNSGTTVATKIWNFPELPAGRMGDYGMGRNWMALPDGTSFIAGDIVGGSSGSSAYNFRDAVLKTSENSFLANGGAFRVPSNLGAITAMRFTSQLDASLGQGALMVATPNGVFSCNANADRSTWQSLTTPILSESLIGLGGLSQNSTIVVNGDLMFRATDGIRSLIMARRDFNSWGNAPISYEMKRVIDGDNAQGLPWCSASQFDNRMMMTSSPASGDCGNYFQSLISLNLDPVSSLQGKSSSVYDGMWTGLNILQFVDGMFNGVRRCFAFTYSPEDTGFKDANGNPIYGKIKLYEILKQNQDRFDDSTIPITWSFETPMFFRSAEGKGFFDLIKLENGEFYVSDIKAGDKVSFKVEYRPDFSQCWYPWHEFSVCNSNDSTVPAYGARLGLGSPDGDVCNDVNSARSNIGRWFQLRFTISGHCVFKGAKIAASLQTETAFAKPICSDE